MDSDICNQPTVTVVLKNATEIVKEIKQSHILQASFVEIQKSCIEEPVLTSLKLPAKTRWDSSLEYLKSISYNQYNLKQLAISKNSNRINKITREVILSDEFRVKIQRMIHLLEPVVIWLKKVEGDESRISEIPQVFIELKQHFAKELQCSSLALLTLTETDKVMNCLTQRSEMVLTPLHFTANILDPKFKGKDLEPSQVAEGSEMISKLCQKFDLSKEKML